MGFGSVLVEHARSDIGHLNDLASLRPGERPQITISNSPNTSRRTFTITKYSSPSDGCLSWAWKYYQAAERRLWYRDSTRKDLDNLAIFLQDVDAIVQEVADHQDPQTKAILSVFETALQSFQEHGLQNYFSSCLEGKPNAKPITQEERTYREQKSRELREQLEAAAAKVKQRIQTTEKVTELAQNIETSRQADGGQYLQRFLDCQKPALERPRDQIVRQGYLFLKGMEHSLFTEEKIEVKIIHLTADRFLQAIKDWGGHFVSLVSATQTFPAIEFGPVEKDFSSKLRDAGLLNSCREQGTWESLESDGKTYLVNRKDYEQILVYLTHHGIDSSKLKVEARADPSVCAQPRTVVLKGGIYCSLYSFLMSQEAAAFLVQGYNVVVFEDKHAKTLHIPSRKQVQQTVNALHAYLAGQGLAPQHILWKGTSLGSISAMIGAATFPGTLGFADQGFVTLTDAVADYLCTYPMTSKWLVRRAVEAFLKYNGMDFDAATVVPQVSGPLCILNNRHDGVIQPAESEKLAGLTVRHGGSHISMDNPKIRHAEGWFKDPAAKAQVLHFLTAAGFAPTPIL
ncbi:MAG: hypothetical protein LLG04_01715 [Parachlamydia sp.]|nr:hypothetical protein [Parachlamydia sp.]